MGQSKINCSRHRALASSKESEKLDLPRLHFTGATVHGIAECYFVSGADLRKDASTAVEQLSHCLDIAMEEIKRRDAPVPQLL